MNQINTVAEIPSYVFCMFTMDHLGRKPLLVASMIFGGVFTLICALFEEGGLRTGMAVLGERAATTGWPISWRTWVGFTLIRTNPPSA